MEQILNMTNTGAELTIQTILLAIGSAIILGGIISLVYMKANRGKHSGNMPLTLFLLPMVISTVVMLIGNNIAGAFSLAGIFSIIKFRSAPGNPKDIMFILITVAIGLACGVKAYLFGMIFTLIGALLLMVLSRFNFGTPKKNFMNLTILVPEDINQDNLFDETITKYTKSYSLDRMRTKDLGSVFEFKYTIEAKDDINKLDFINELRCRNGNMNIKLETGIKENDF